MNVGEPLRSLDDQRKLQLLTAMIGLFDRTFSSDLPDRVKSRRADICANPIDTPIVFSQFLHRLAFEDGCGPVQSTKFVEFVGNINGGDSTDQELYSSVIVT
jgi:hypothetical protein